MTSSEPPRDLGRVIAPIAAPEPLDIEDSGNNLPDWDVNDHELSRCSHSHPNQVEIVSEFGGSGMTLPRSLGGSLRVNFGVNGKVKS